MRRQPFRGGYLFGLILDVIGPGAGLGEVVLAFGDFEVGLGDSFGVDGGVEGVALMEPGSILYAACSLSSVSAAVLRLASAAAT